MKLRNTKDQNVVEENIDKQKKFDYLSSINK